MAGRNQRSATLPPNLRHGIQQPTEETEGFFSKLKKKFKLKKGRYHVDVSTGECQNVAPVSFKKRGSRELLDDDSPWQLRDPRSEMRDVKVHSPKVSKKFLSKQTGKQATSVKVQERKLSNPETYTRSLNSTEVNSLQRKSFGAYSKTTNEYSPLAYDTKENPDERSQKLRENALKNDTVVHDDSAIEIDTEAEVTNKISSESDTLFDVIGLDPGYEKLPERRHSSHENKTRETMKNNLDPKYKSVPKGQDKLNFEFDPNYESVDEVKSRIVQKTDQESEQFEDDPRYQSVRDVKREAPEKAGGEMIRPAKTYNINKSIESLDEPGYECLNDVKMRIQEQNFVKSDNKAPADCHIGSKTVEISQTDSGDDFNDSAIGSVPKLSCLPTNESSSSCLSADGIMVTTESNGGVRAFAETAVSLTGFAAALTASGTSKDSGFESERRALDTEQEENLYSSVQKSGKASDSECPYSSVNKEGKQSNADQRMESVQVNRAPSASEPISDPALDGYDSDTGVMLDPGYAECADAIKGIIPYSVYSEGSGSKMSSCTSLDLSAEDFAIEPGYAECADAIKSGAIKKISISHERLFDQSVGTRHEEHKSGGEISCEIYANPQILLRKRSKLIDDNVKDKSKSVEETDSATDKSKSDKEICSTVKKKSKKKETKSKKSKEDKQMSVEAPPLPARNYSLYLENEEAEEIVQEVLQDIGNTDSVSLDDAFESVESATPFTETTDTNSDSKLICLDKSDRVIVETEVTEVKQVETSCPETEKFTDSRTDSEKNVNSDDLNDDSNLKCCGGMEGCQSDHCSNSDNCGVVKTESYKEAPICCSDTDMHLINCKMSSLKAEADSGTINETENSVEDNNCVTDNLKSLNDAQLVESCLHVDVKDELGYVKTITVVEKEESVELQKRRENSRKKAGNSPAKMMADSTEGPFVGADCNKSEIEKEDDSHVPHVEECKETDPIDPDSTKLLASKNSSVDPVFCSIGVVSTSNSSNTELLPTLTRTLASTSSDEGTFRYMDTYQSNISNNINTLSDTDSNNFLTVAVKMKTISIDSDSDFCNTEDLPKLEINESDLESPFDSSDNSNNLDIESESADIDKLTQRLKAEDITKMITNMTMCNVDQDLKQDEENTPEIDSAVSHTSKQDKDDYDALNSDSSRTRTPSYVEDSNSCVSEFTSTGFDKEVPQCSDNSLQNEAHNADVMQSDVTSRDTYQVQNEVLPEVSDCGTDRKATLESRLCVIESENEGKPDICKLIESYADGVIAGADNDELSDDSAIGNGNDLQQMNSTVHSETNNEVDVVDNADQILLENGSSADTVSSTELHLMYQAQHPNLYEDSEPTHMSLEEAMGLSPTAGHSTMFHSDDHVQSLQTTREHDSFDQSDIPDAEESAFPPPRPPPVSSDVQMRSRISAAGQTNQGNSVTPTDDGSPIVRFSYCPGESEEVPPAIPPRSKSASTSRRSDRASYSQDFMESMRQLKDCGWYWGPLSWEEAELKLAKKPEGTFLVRDSSDEHYILSLSFKNQGRVHHTRIEHHKGHFSFWSQPDSHGKSTIKEFIEQCVENSRNGRFLYFIRPSGPGSPPMPIQLLHPVSRFVQMRSLQHMCRFRILQLVRRDHIDHLPIPTRIKQYLKEAQYYVEYLDD